MNSLGFFFFFPPSDVNVPSQPAPTTSISQQPVVEPDQATRQFIDFLKTVQKPGRDIFKQCHSFCHSVAYKKVLKLYSAFFFFFLKEANSVYQRCNSMQQSASVSAQCSKYPYLYLDLNPKWVWSKTGVCLFIYLDFFFF